jgi:hypothetical protein
VPGGLAVATQQANRAHDRERELRQHQQRRDGWLEANAHLGPQYRQVVRTLAWQRRATGLAVEADRPSYVLEALGPVPESTRGRRAWRQAAAEIEQYRYIYQITDPDRALGPEPHDPSQLADRQRARTAIARVQAKQRATDRSRDPQSTSERTSQADLQAILAHLGDDPDELLAGTDADQPVVALRVQATVGRPGGAAQARWRQLRAAEWTTWMRTLPWRVAVLLGIGVGGGVLGSLLAPRLGLIVGGLAAVVVGWGLRFRPSPDAVAWRRGAAGERRTAHLLAALERDGWVVLHDLAATRSPLSCARCRSRPTKPPRSLPTRAWPWCRSWPSTAPRSRGARWSPTACRSCRPGACQACSDQLPAVLGSERVAVLADQARLRFHAAA